MADDEDNYSWLREELPPVSSFWQVESRTVGELLNHIFKLAVLFARDYSEKDVAANMAQTFAAMSTSGDLLPIMIASLLGRSGYWTEEQVKTFHDGVMGLLAATNLAREGDSYSHFQMEAIRLIIEKSLYQETLETLISQPRARYPSQPLSHVWEIIRLMRKICWFVEPAAGKNINNGPIKMREDGAVWTGEFLSFRRTVGQHIGEGKGSATLRSVAQKIYLNELMHKGISHEDTGAGERQIARGWKLYKKWLDNMPDAVRNSRPRIVIRNLADPDSPSTTYFMGSGLESWQDRRKKPRKKLRGVNRKRAIGSDR